MSATSYSLHYPSEIVFGPETSGMLAEKLVRFRRILLVTGSHFAKSPEFEKLRNTLKEHEVRVETGIHAEPPLADVDRVTASGTGALGLPRLKSNTFSAPISALRALPYAVSSRIQFLTRPQAR